MDSLTLTTANLIMVCIFVFLFGLCIGSFLNVVISRLPGLTDPQLSDPSEQPPANLISPRSRCPACKHKIRWSDNIPLISYLLLKGKCRHCSQAISTQYFWIELLTGVLFVLCLIRFGISETLIWSTLLTSLLIALAMIDLKTWLLPDSITLPGILLGLACSLFNHFASVVDAVTGAIAGYLILWAIYKIHHRITGREGMGYGDFKLMAMLGAWLGWYSLPIIMLVSSLAGLVIFALMKLAYQFDHRQPIPFGPFLSIAGWIVMINHNMLHY
jgi:leader peptidase (prepilin peptidase)/N-methyltransferase